MWAVKVPGVPMPKGSLRPIVGKDGRARLIDDTHKKPALNAWRETVRAAGTLIAHHLDQPLDEPVSVTVAFTLPAPAGDAGRAWPHKKPGNTGAGGGDLDKLVRVVLDELTTAGVWRDDSRVVELTASKHYPGRPGADVLDEPGAIIRVWRTSELAAALQ